MTDVLFHSLIGMSLRSSRTLSCSIFQLKCYVVQLVLWGLLSIHENCQKLLDKRPELLLILNSPMKVMKKPLYNVFIKLQLDLPRQILPTRLTEERKIWIISILMEQTKKSSIIKINRMDLYFFLLLFFCGLEACYCVQTTADRNQSDLNGKNFFLFILFDTVHFFL